MLFKEISVTTNGTYRPPYVHGGEERLPECYPIGTPGITPCIKPIGFADGTCPVPVPYPKGTDCVVVREVHR